MFRFQVPGNGGAVLLQSITDLSKEAKGGGGVFAWATSSGVNVLLQSPDFTSFLKRAPFSLTIGTDSITDLKALNALRKAQETYPLLTIKAVLNESKGLFHPKIAWFIGESSIQLVVGSGNLTRGGLLGNWEAYSVTDVDIDELESLELALEDWLETVSPGLLPLDDPRVEDRVSQNSGDERSVKKPTTSLPVAASKEEDYSGWLVAELNKNRKDDATGRSMFSQASFDATTFKSFFDYAGKEVDVVLHPVDETGKLGALESRKGRFKAKSSNYYFELGSAQGRLYPEIGRPLAIFGRLVSGGYIYRVLAPGDEGHAEVAAWLASNAPAAPTRMRRKIISTLDLSAAWPGNPMLSAEVPAS